MDTKELREMTKTVRSDIVTMIHKAGSGHPGGSLSAAELVTALYFEVMKVDPADPAWEGRDRFILSKGHVARRAMWRLSSTVSLRGRAFFRWKSFGRSEDWEASCRDIRTGRARRDSTAPAVLWDRGSPSRTALPSALRSRAKITGSSV